MEIYHEYAAGKAGHCDMNPALWSSGAFMLHYYSLILTEPLRKIN